MFGTTVRFGIAEEGDVLLRERQGARGLHRERSIGGHGREGGLLRPCLGQGRGKFAATGLTPVRSELVDAPYVEECPLVLECKVVQTVELGLHTQFVGRTGRKVSEELEPEIEGGVDWSSQAADLRARRPRLLLSRKEGGEEVGISMASARASASLLQAGKKPKK